ncbi:hypothetical protein BKA64DRAFT_640142 [Cadophora sp. MPI-SDFR-AT-0126]|nr:hypothetical protein BKA64DRAFT_640142 [Leotiomycetes sp. MPI-SDFR-AT-0126]
MNPNFVTEVNYHPSTESLLILLTQTTVMTSFLLGIGIIIQAIIQRTLEGKWSYSLSMRKERRALRSAEKREKSNNREQSKKQEKRKKRLTKTGLMESLNNGERTNLEGMPIRDAAYFSDTSELGTEAKGFAFVSNRDLSWKVSEGRVEVLDEDDISYQFSG